MKNVLIPYILLHGDPVVKTIVERMLDEGIQAIRPQLTERGISYPLLEDLGTAGVESAKSLLEELVANGVFERKLVDRIILCPSCKGYLIRSKYHCPKCDAFNIEQVSFIEHTTCGYIDSRKKFEKGEDLVCPKCLKQLSVQDSRPLGQSFECNECGFRFDSPKILEHCNVCGEFFGSREALYSPIFEYLFTEEAKQALSKGALLLSAIEEALKQEGFQVTVRGSLAGKSGAEHKFDIIAKRGEELLTANLAFDVTNDDLVSLFAKKYDTSPKYPMLITLSKPSPQVEAIGESYGIGVLSGSKTSEITEKLKQMVKAPSISE